MKTERMSSKKPPRILLSIEIVRKPVPLPISVAGPIDRCWQVFIDSLRNTAHGLVTSFANRSPQLAESGLSILDMRP
jgi:hypothetical protein